MDKPDDLITQREAAALVNRPVGTVRAWVSDGKVRVRKRALLGGSWVALVSRAEVEEYAARVGADPRGAGVRRAALEVDTDDLTAEELDAFVEMRRANAPAWFHEEARRRAREAPRVEIVLVRMRELFREKKRRAS